jgi:predicted protein tyrosine phosphatase
LQPVEEDPFAEMKVVKQEDPIFLPTHTQKRRTELVVLSNEEEFRKNQYPTIYERVKVQLDWAETQLEDEKMVTKKEAIKRSMDKALLMAKAQSTTFDENNELDEALEKLQQEDEKKQDNNNDETVVDFTNIHNPELKEKFIKQYLEIKERKIMTTRNTQPYHEPFSYRERRNIALKFFFGFKNISSAYKNSKDVTFVLPWLLIGRKEIAHNMQQLLSFNITHILNMTHDVKSKFNKHFMYEKIAVKDSIDSDMTPHFNTMIQFIKRTEDSKGRVRFFYINKLSITNDSEQILVHCNAGASRAPTAVLAYLLVQKKIPLVDAYNYLQYVRPFTQPNKKFLYQLAMLEVSRIF